jgi:hypothetical protein
VNLRRYLARGEIVATLALFGAGGASGCKPSSVADAESKGDVAWLDAEGSPAAIEAIGRIADKDTEAVTVLQGRAKFDVSAYIAAWGGVKRGAKWGSDLLHAGLQDPARAEVAASAVEGKDPAIEPFVPDVEAAMTRLAATGATSTLAAVLAAAGAPAHDAVVRRLADKVTRGAMCGGISVATGSADARAVLRSVPATSRDDQTCVGAVTMLAATDDATLKWLAEQAEPGLLGAAGRLPTLECPRLQRLWTGALAARGGSQAGAMTVALANAVKRCPAEMDGVIADAIKTKPDALSAAIGAIDPFSPDDRSLRATCASLQLVAPMHTTPILKERATDAIAHGCKGVP